MKKIIWAILALALNGGLFAEQKAGKLFMGPSVGYVFAGVGYGVGAEYAIHDNWNVGVDLSYTNFKQDLNVGFGYSYTTTYTLFGALAGVSYHLWSKQAFDPFVKIGVGYFNWGVSVKDQNGVELASTSSLSLAYTSGIGVGGQLGARYHFTDNISARASVGWPFYVAAGADFAIAF
jgi:outer membrane protein W